MPKPLKKIGKGLWQSILGALVGFALMSVVSLFVKVGVFPEWAVTALGVFNVVSSLLMLKAAKRWAVLYAVGWLAGGAVFLYLGLFGTLDIILNVAAPILILLFRFLIRVGKGTRRVLG